MEHIRSYKDLRVYKAAIDAAVRIFEITKHFPMEERFSMTDQMRRASRSVLLEHRRSVAKATLPSAFCKQAKRLRGGG